MAKKKDKPQVINNIGELNLEIDYDKLAEAIVRAQQRANEIEITYEDAPQFPWYKRLYYFIFNNSPQKSTGLNKFFRLIVLLFFRLCSFMSLVLLPFVFILCVSAASRLEYGLKNIFDWLWLAEIYILTPFALLILLVVTWDAGNQLSQEKDKNIIMSAFSNVTGFVALIVALIALFKGVG